MRQHIMFINSIPLVSRIGISPEDRDCLPLSLGLAIPLCRDGCVKRPLLCWNTLVTSFAEDACGACYHVRGKPSNRLSCQIPSGGTRQRA